MVENTKGDSANPLGLYTWLPFGPFDTAEAFITQFFNVCTKPNKSDTLFAIYNKNPDSTEEMAGLYRYVFSSDIDLSTEIGPAITFPRFQGTHVTSNTISLLLHYALDLPLKGLGLRRVQWETNIHNAVSRRVAEKMGFVKESIMRWRHVLSPAKAIIATNRQEIRKGDPREGCAGRDTVMFALCWDDWESGGREHADAVMQRK